MIFSSVHVLSAKDVVYIAHSALKCDNNIELWQTTQQKFHNSATFHDRRAHPSPLPNNVQFRKKEISLRKEPCRLKYTQWVYSLLKPISNTQKDGAQELSLEKENALGPSMEPHKLKENNLQKSSFFPGS